MALSFRREKRGKGKKKGCFSKRYSLTSARAKLILRDTQAIQRREKEKGQLEGEGKRNLICSIAPCCAMREEGTESSARKREEKRSLRPTFSGGGNGNRKAAKIAFGTTLRGEEEIATGKKRGEKEPFIFSKGQGKDLRMPRALAFGKPQARFQGRGKGRSGSLAHRGRQ